MKDQTAPGVRGGNSKSGCRGHRRKNSVDRALDRPPEKGIDRPEIFRRSRKAKFAADLRLWSRSRGFLGEAEERKSCRRRRFERDFRSEMIFPFEGGRVG